MSEPPPLPPPLPAEAVAVPLPELRRGFFQRVAFAFDWLFGLMALIALLAACSVIPGLNFLSLGYLLQVSGTIARTGRFRDGFIGVRKASVLGSIAAGTWLVVWPARLVSGFWKDAEIIAPGSSTSQAWHGGLFSSRSSHWRTSPGPVFAVASCATSSGRNRSAFSAGSRHLEN